MAPGPELAAVLAPHRAAAAFDRLDRLARAARAGGDARNLAQLRADAMCDVLAGVPFALAPTVDPVTAEADASEQLPDLPLSKPNWTTESRFPTRRTDGGPVDETAPVVEPPGVIDMYEYDRACLTDLDRAWVDIGSPAPAAGAFACGPGWWMCRSSSQP